MGPKLVNCCRPEEMGTKEIGKMMKNQILEEGRVPAKEAKNWKIEGDSRGRHRKAQTWYKVRREVPEAFRKWEQKAKTSKKEWKGQRGIVAACQWKV